MISYGSIKITCGDRKIAIARLPSAIFERWETEQKPCSLRELGFLIQKKVNASIPFFELKNPWLRQRFSVRRGDKIRTCDPLHPIQVRYRAAPLPEQNGLQN